MTPVLSMFEAGVLPLDQWDARVAAAVEAGWTAVELPADVAAERVVAARDRGWSPVVLRWVDGADRPPPASAEVGRRERACAVVTADLERAAELGVSVVTVRPAESRWDSGPEVVPEYTEALQMAQAALRSLVPAAARSGVAIGVEAAIEGFLTSPIEARELMELVRSPDIGICLDVAALSGIGRPVDWIRTLRHRLVCVRIGDGAEGLIDEVVAALAEVRYAGPVVWSGDPSARGRLGAAFGSAGVSRQGQ